MLKYDKGEMFFTLIMPEIDKMTKEEIIEYLRNQDSKVGKTASTDDVESHFIDNNIDISCPNCGTRERVKIGKYDSGVQAYKCKGCNKKYSITKNTIFEGTDYTWTEMVDIVFYVITKQSIDFICNSIRSTAIKQPNIWLMVHKILHLLAQMPKPDLVDVIQIDEKYIRKASIRI